MELQFGLSQLVLLRFRCELYIGDIYLGDLRRDEEGSEINTVDKIKME